MMPFVTVLIALRAEIAAALAADNVTVRHARHREPRTDELPCVNIHYVSADPSGQYGEQTTSGGSPEQVMELAVNLAITMELEEEADDPADLTGDPTGYAGPAAIMSKILDRLFPDLEAGALENTLGGMVWQMRYDGTANDEGDASPDAARIEERLTLFYRVRADHPTTLLMGS